MAGNKIRFLSLKGRMGQCNIWQQWKSKIMVVSKIGNDICILLMDDLKLNLIFISQLCDKGSMHIFLSLIFVLLSVLIQAQ